MRTTAIRAAVACGVLLLIQSTGLAGILNGHVDALPGFTGTAPYANGNLSGTVDYAVFTAADFNSNFAGMGYVPGDTFVYTYQILNAELPNSDAVSALSIPLANPANTIGTFSIGTVDSSSEILAGISAQWLFLTPEIGAGQTSYGLAFSSATPPISAFGTVVDGGSAALALGLPTPFIPEPSTLLLVASGGMLMTVRRRWN